MTDKTKRKISSWFIVLLAWIGVEMCTLNHKIDQLVLAVRELKR